MAEEKPEQTAHAAPLPPERVKEMLDAGDAELVDVRQEHEWEAGRIPGAKHVGLNDLSAQAEKLAGDGALVVYCHGGSRSAMAAEALRTAGIDAHSLEGGIDAWVERGMPIEPEDGHVAESGRAAEILRERGRYAPFPEDAARIETDD